MASPPYGHRKGEPVLVQKKVDASTTAILAGDFVTEGTQGYVQQAAAGSSLIGVAWGSCSVPASDGEITISVDVGGNCVYEYPPDTGTVTQALAGRTMDIGGAQSIDIDASTDGCIMCHEVDTVANTLMISLLPTRTGIV